MNASNSNRRDVPLSPLGKSCPAFLLLLTLAIFLFAPTAHADFYVHLDGNDATGDGSFGAPWRSLGHVRFGAAPVSLAEHPFFSLPSQHTFTLTPFQSYISVPSCSSFVPLACAQLEHHPDRSPLHIGAGEFVVNVRCLLNRNVSGSFEQTVIKMQPLGYLLWQREPVVVTPPPPYALSAVSIISDGIQKDTTNAAVFVYNSRLAIDSVAFASNSSCMLRALIRAHLSVTNCSFTGFCEDEDDVSVPTSKNLVEVTYGTHASFSESSFHDIKGFNLALYSETSSTILLYSTTFSDITTRLSINSQGAVLIRGSTLTVDQCRFARMRAYMGSAITVFGPTLLTIRDSSFIDNFSELLGAVFVFEAQAAMISNSHFINNTVQTEAAGIGMYVLQSDSVTLVDCTFINNSVISQTESAFARAASGLNFANSTQIQLSGGWYGSDSPNSPNFGVPPIMVLGSGITITHSPTNGKLPFLTGALFGASHVTLTADWTINGPVYFVAQLGSSQLSTFDLAGHRLRIDSDSPFRFSPLATQFQHAQFLNGAVDLISGRSYVCCASGDPDQAHNIWENATLNLFGTARLDFFSFIMPPRFIGPNSGIFAMDNSFLYMSATETLNITAPLVHMRDISVFLTSDTHLYGNLIVDSKATLLTFPSKWNDVEHPLVVYGDAQIDGNLWLRHDLGLLPFSPIVTLHDTPSRALVTTGTLIVSEKEYIDSRIKYNVSRSSNAIFGTPHRIIPDVTISNDLTSLVVETWIDTGVPIALDCRGFLDLSLAQTHFDIPTLRCVQQTSTSIIITSASLPYAPETLEIDPLNEEFMSRPILPPKFPVVPTALIQPLPSTFTCSQVTLDGSLSTGIGAYPADFNWTLVETTDPSDRADLIRTLLATSPRSSTIQIPATLFYPNFRYVFSLTVTNVAGVRSEAMILDFEPQPDAFVPPLTIDGPPLVKLFPGADLHLIARVQDKECPWDSSNVDWKWTIQNGATGVETDINDFPSSFPSLWLPSSYFDSLEPPHILKVYAYPGQLPSNINATLAITVMLAPRPLVAVSQSKFSFVEEDIVLKIDVGTHDPTMVRCDWASVSCPNTDLRSFFGTKVAYRGPFHSIELQDCINSTGQAFKIPFTNLTGLSTSIPRESLEFGAYLVQASCYENPNGPIESRIVQKIVIPFRVERLEAAFPLVSISFPPTSELASSRKFSLVAEVTNPRTGTTLTGLDAEEAYEFTWRLHFGSYTIPPHLNSRSSLTIPHGSLVDNQHVFVALEVRALDSDSLPSTGIAVVQLPVLSAPSGGSIIVLPMDGSPLQTPFTVLAPSWTTAFAPLRYQFSFVHPVSGIETILSDLSSSPSYDNIIFESFESFADPSVENLTIPLRVRVFDSIGSVSTSETNITLHRPRRRDEMQEFNDIFEPAYPHEFPLANLLRALSVSVNSSNWRDANSILFTIVSMAKSRQLTDAQMNILLDATSKLPFSVSFTESNSASVLSQIAFILETLPLQDSNQSDQLRALLSAILGSDSSHFGSSSSSSEQSSQSFTRIMSSMLERRSAVDSKIPLSLITSHMSQVLHDMLPGEAAFETRGAKLSTSSSLLPTKGRLGLITQVGTDNGRVDVTVDPTQFHARSTDGYIGVNYLAYDGTYPGLVQANEGFDTVIDVSFVKPTSFNNRERRSKSLSLAKRGENGAEEKVEGQYKAKFDLEGKVSETVLESKPPACSVYDSSTKTWSSSGCRTERGAGGKVTCHRSKGGPLTILFGGAAAAPSKHTKGVTIAIAVIVPIVIIAIIAVGVVVAWKAGAFAKPLSAEDEAGRYEFSVATTSPPATNGWHSGSKPPTM